MLRRTFLKACSALAAAIPLLPSFMRREVKRVTLTYRGKLGVLQLKELITVVMTFNSVPLAGVPADEMFLNYYSWRIYYEGLQPVVEIITVHERGKLPRFNGTPLYKSVDPILRSATLIKQDIEYA